MREDESVIIKSIIKDINEMIAEMKKKIDPNPQWERDLYFGKGYITACEIIRKMLEERLK